MSKKKKQRSNTLTTESWTVKTRNLIWMGKDKTVKNNPTGWRKPTSNRQELKSSKHIHAHQEHPKEKEVKCNFTFEVFAQEAPRSSGRSIASTPSLASSFKLFFFFFFKQYELNPEKNSNRFKKNLGKRYPGYRFLWEKECPFDQTRFGSPSIKSLLSQKSEKRKNHQSHQPNLGNPNGNKLYRKSLPL